MRLATPLLALALTLVGCDAAVPEVPPPTETPVPDPGPSDVGNPVARGAELPQELYADFHVSLGSRLLTFVGLRPPTGAPEETEFHHDHVSLWLTGRQDGAERFLAGAKAIGASYEPCVPVEPPYAPFLLSGALDYDLGEWPTDLGAPLGDDGRPRVYGDVMAWDAFCPDPDNGSHFPERHLRDVRVNTAAFSYSRPDLALVRFFRYEITNTGDAPIEDLRAGHFSDPDVSRAYWSNFVGGTEDFAYVYTRPVDPYAVPGMVTALPLLETPGDAPVDVRRVVYRGVGPSGEGGPTETLSARGLQSSPDALFHALRGLTDDGRPIVDPTTGQPTTRMFGGDPVAGTGWVDGTYPGGEAGWDVRLLQGTAPLTLAPGETVVLTAASVSALGDDFADGLADVDALVRAVRAEPALWRFPIASD